MVRRISESVQVSWDLLALIAIFFSDFPQTEIALLVQARKTFLETLKKSGA